MPRSPVTAAPPTPRLPAAVRRQRIQQMLAEEGFVAVAEIARRFGVSAMSVRRDLDALAGAGKILRSHGTALQPARQAADEHELQYETRRRRAGQAKDRIARAAAALLVPGEMVAFDVGSTVLALAREVAGSAGLRVFTNHLRAASLLAAAGSEVVIPGGAVRPREMSVCGASAVDQVRNHWFHQCFLGVSGVGADGCFDYSWDDCEVKRAYIERSERVVVLCDASKFDHKAVARVCRLDQVALLVSDAPPPPALKKILKKAGVQVMVA
ncbi:MAG: DeoR/GlpR transcriptional regulator [Burkholderiales bacterium]|nr:DeoR/GlpR transcriptional regulator [Burkholderiales bacterium]